MYLLVYSLIWDSYALGSTVLEHCGVQLDY